MRTTQPAGTQRHSARASRASAMVDEHIADATAVLGEMNSASPESVCKLVKLALAVLSEQAVSADQASAVVCAPVAAYAKYGLLQTTALVLHKAGVSTALCIPAQHALPVLQNGDGPMLVEELGAPAGLVIALIDAVGTAGHFAAGTAFIGTTKELCKAGAAPRFAVGGFAATTAGELHTPPALPAAVPAAPPSPLFPTCHPQAAGQPIEKPKLPGLDYAAEKLFILGNGTIGRMYDKFGAGC